jgi:hypothetical protein
LQLPARQALHTDLCLAKSAPPADLLPAGSAPDVHDDYVVVPDDGGPAADAPGGGRRGALVEPPPGAFPLPTMRFTLCNLQVAMRSQTPWRLCRHDANPKSP